MKSSTLILLFSLSTLIWTSCKKEEEPVVETPATTPTPTYTKGTTTDSRDNITYATVTIGTQTWMAENLRFNETTSWVNPNYPSGIYGRLYSYFTAVNICPGGWHLPSDEEWKTLEKELGLSAEDADLSAQFRGSFGTTMKATTGWNSSGNGTNITGFNAFASGYYKENDGSYNNLGVYASFWSATSFSGGNSWIRTLAYNSSGISRSTTLKRDGHACRCVQD